MNETTSTVMSNWETYIDLDPGILLNKPVIRNTYMPVEALLKLMQAGWTEQQILTSYPHLTKENLRAALEYGQELIEEEWY